MDDWRAAISASVEERFWAKVNKTETCWLWVAGLTSRGYGSFWVAPKQEQAHRVSYLWAYGYIPEGLLVDHKCRNKACARPSHLRLATHKQNHENLSGAYRCNSSGILGVNWNKAAQKWKARVRHNGKLYELGYFTDKDAAEEAAVAKRRELYTHYEPTGYNG